MWKKFNANPAGKSVGDCTVRAISAALGKPWHRIYWDLCRTGCEMCDMPSSNAVWGEYLRRQGCRKHIVPDSCPECYTVEEFCMDHPCGTYILALSGHVVCTRDGILYDTWDSRPETVIYFWEV